MPLVGARPDDANMDAAEPEPEVDAELVLKPPWRPNDGWGKRSNNLLWWEKFAGEEALYLLLQVRALLQSASRTLTLQCHVQRLTTAARL
eukprot:SAG22_NODE_6591_length_834_cov_1.278912_1_plen_90_part_00